MTARVEVSGIGVELGGRRVVDDVSFAAKPGEVIGIVGPNGSGKSTLLRAMIGILTPAAGSVHIDGLDVAKTKARDRARVLAAVLQDATGDFDLTVQDVVMMGRACYKKAFERDDDRDRTVVADALRAVGAVDLRDRRFAFLSGGERQRVLIARAIAQQPRVLVMDEPTNHLDLRHQFDALALPRKLGVTAVIALHDLNLAAHYCDQLLVLHHGRQVRSGTPEEVLNSETLAEVYGVAAAVTPHPVTGRPHITLDPTHQAETGQPPRSWPVPGRDYLMEKESP
ncbi:ABC transporter ATP-binding protein [Kibdelosporangium aridum]|uniref:Iron complex transport system ATP-binding protein n=1 Tax=Kibdelosporangium aridum TaxID=2030 RepID=A0A1W2FVC5_KIBAR|nr:ABC transporter ATP-binding protein [Kibdelosporangium aridum]SMD25596.1 iron complex transport system ATP-binding protein [Kibdelosporangium aridum]